ncbi:transposase [Salmonella enterica]|uniref:transposase n=1 Tax=Salmonella enterica TaxID=28901 RepID=UPI001C5643FD
MSGKRYPEEVIIKGVKQVNERALPVAGIATRLGMLTRNLFAWIKPPYSRRYHAITGV